VKFKGNKEKNVEKYEKLRLFWVKFKKAIKFEKIKEAKI